MEAQGSYPLPEDPALAEVARALRDTGHWAWVVDDRWRAVYATDEIRLSFGAGTELAPWALGEHVFGPENRKATLRWIFGTTTPELVRILFAFLGGWSSLTPQAAATSCASSSTPHCGTWSIGSLPQTRWRSRARALR